MSKDKEVGYGNPPEAGKFKKGQSGNPAGRPKTRGKKQEEFGKLFNWVLNQPMEISENGKEATFTKREVLAMAVVHAALKGDARAWQIVLKYAENYHDPDTFEVDARDGAMLERYVQRIAKGKEAPDDSEDEDDQAHISD